MSSVIINEFISADYEVQSISLDLFIDGTSRSGSNNVSLRHIFSKTYKIF